MTEKIEGSKRSGTFTIAPGKDVYGELTLDGEKTTLYLRDHEHFNVHDIPEKYISGILHDLTKVSLIQCISPGTGSHGSKDGHYYFAEILPHHVLHGNCHLTPIEKIITEVHFVIDDATTLFYDFDAFGSIGNAHTFIEEITSVNAKALERKITTGPRPQIAYFTGKTEIFAANTVWGKISASHSPTYAIGGPDGIRIKNTIFVTIAFKEPVKFDDALSPTFMLVRYFDILIGRPQNLLKLHLSIKPDGQDEAILPVYCSTPRKREISRSERAPHPSDVLLDAVREPEIFSKVLESWLSRQEDWHEARLRFSNCFFDQHSYSIDRLVAAANMFDILPEAAAPFDVPLSEELKTAKKTCCDIFSELPLSIERDSILSALGRLGKSSLKHKIRHRAQFILDKLDTAFPEMFYVIDKAVKCRNHYVHGSEGDFNYTKNFDAVAFFTNTLEFIFAASDLIEAGWDIKNWIKDGTVMSHPFAAYRVNYKLCLQNLKALQKKPSTAA